MRGKVLGFMGFDIEEHLKRIFAPYTKMLSIFTLLATVILSLIVLIPPIRVAVNFHQWNEWLLVVISLAWLIGIIISFVLVLHFLGITLNKFGNLFIALDVFILVTLIVVTSLLPGQQICSAQDHECTLFDNLVWIFAILQPIIFIIYLRNKLAYITGFDPFLILRKIFGSKP